MTETQATETRLTREQLYEQVWSTPMRKLAMQYGLSDVGLAKVCKRHDIPRPPVGYWARKQHGYKDAKTPLPEIQNGKNEEIVLGLPIADAEHGDSGEIPCRVNDPEVTELIEAEADPANKITVSETLRSPHRLVVETRDRSKPSKLDHDGYPSSQDAGRRRQPGLRIDVIKDSYLRALRIADALVKAIEQRGFQFVSDGADRWPRALIQLLDEKFAFRVTEKTRRVPHELTLDEKRRKEKSGYSYHDKYDYLPTGQLELRLLSDSNSQVKAWRDGKRRRVEDCLNLFLVELYVEAVTSRDNRIRWAKEERARWEEQRRQREVQEQRARLEAQSAAWAKAEEIRSFVAAAREDALRRHGEIDDDSEFARWLTWAKEQADQIDPLIGGEGQSSREEKRPPQIEPTQDWFGPRWPK